MLVHARQCTMLLIENPAINLGFDQTKNQERKQAKFFLHRGSFSGSGLGEYPTETSGSELNLTTVVRSC